MNTAPQGNLTIVARLRAALEETAAALVAADLDRLLAADTALQGALDALPSGAPIFRRQTHAAAAPAERALVRGEIEGAIAALLRCRRLGAGLTDFVRLSLDARGEQLGYESTRTTAAALTGRGFSQRV